MRSEKKYSKKDLIGFNDFWLWLIGIPIVSFLFPIIFFRITPSENITAFVNHFITSLFFVSTYWYVDRLIVCYLRNRIPHISDYWKRISLQIIFVYLFTFLFCYSSNDFCEYMFSEYCSECFKPDFDLIIIASLMITTLILAIYESIYAANMWKNAFLEAESLKKENIKSQLQSLKNQVNPHFLFNSLNTLASIIPENPRLSVEFVEKLSKVYRHILEIKDQELITLNQELDAVQSYVFLLKTRFGSNLHIHFFLNKIDKYIIPLSVQMLIENAIKHNIISASKPLTITITEKDNNLIVENNLQLKAQVLDSTKTGLSNISNRYRLLANKEVDIIRTNNKFIVTIPLISIK